MRKQKKIVFYAVRFPISVCFAVVLFFVNKHTKTEATTGASVI